MAPAPPTTSSPADRQCIPLVRPSVDECAAHGLRIARSNMNETSNGPSARFGAALRDRPLGTSVGLVVEYAMFASGLGLAMCLFATRVPLRIADRALGLRLRE